MGAVIGVARRVGAELGFPEVSVNGIATVAAELANNLWMHTDNGGWIRIAWVDAPRTGIEISATDDGPGIGDIELAMTEGYSTTGTLGCGLPGVRRLMDTFDIVSRAGGGTFIVVRKWLTGGNTWRTHSEPWP
ncbi:anti-sigma regulatory factor [Methylolobus aquaticus]